MAPTDPRRTIGTKIDTKAVHVTSLEKRFKRYEVNKNTRILIVTVLEVKIGMKATELSRRRNFVVARFDLGGKSMKAATINIRSVKLHTPEPPCPFNGGDGVKRDAAASTNTNGDTTVAYTVSVQFFEAPAPDPLNYEAFRVVVAQPMVKMTGRPISSLAEAGGSVVGVFLAHVMDASTVEMPPPLPLP